MRTLAGPSWTAESNRYGIFERYEADTVRPVNAEFVILDRSAGKLLSRVTALCRPIEYATVMRRCLENMGTGREYASTSTYIVGEFKSTIPILTIKLFG
jgi:hypothetical protein